MLPAFGCEKMIAAFRDIGIGAIRANSHPDLGQNVDPVFIAAFRATHLE
jgi:hypothetical protein